MLADLLPQRLAQAWAGRVGDGRIGQMTDKTLNAIATGIKAWTLSPSGTEGYAKAEVTLGGVDTAARSCRAHP